MGDLFYLVISGVWYPRRLLELPELITATWGLEQVIKGHVLQGNCPMKPMGRLADLFEPLADLFYLVFSGAGAFVAFWNFRSS